MTAAEAISNTQRESSFGHVGNHEGYEYFTVEDRGELILVRALLSNPITPYGYRNGARYVCKPGNLPPYLECLFEV
jgi:hypothetical protein